MSNNMDEHYFSCDVSIILKKASDTINHKIVHDQLNCYDYNYSKKGNFWTR